MTFLNGDFFKECHLATLNFNKWPFSFFSSRHSSSEEIAELEKKLNESKKKRESLEALVRSLKQVGRQKSNLY